MVFVHNVNDTAEVSAVRNALAACAAGVGLRVEPNSRNPGVRPNPKPDGDTERGSYSWADPLNRGHGSACRNGPGCRFHAAGTCRFSH